MRRFIGALLAFLLAVSPVLAGPMTTLGAGKPPGGGGGGGNTLNPTTGTPGQKSGVISVTGGNLTASNPTGSNYGSVLSISGLASGTKSFSVHVDVLVGGSPQISIGVANSSKDTSNGGNSWVGGGDFNSTGFYNDGATYALGVSTGGHATFVQGDTVNVSVNRTAGTVTFDVNGAGSFTENIPAGDAYVYIGLDTAGSQVTVNLTGYP